MAPLLNHARLNSKYRDKMFQVNSIRHIDRQKENPFKCLTVLI